MAATNISLTPLESAYTFSGEANSTHLNPSNLYIGGFSLYGSSKTVLQFYVDNAVSKSKINQVTLNIAIKHWWHPDQTPAGDLSSKPALYYSSALTNGVICNALTHVNFNNLVTQGTNEKINVSAGYLTPRSNSIDITSIVANNINNNILTIVLDGMYGVQPMMASLNSISLLINYEEVEPVAPLVIAPNGTYENRSNDIKFEWIYKSQTEATQASASLEYRRGTSGVFTSINVYSSNNYYVLGANVLSEGVYEWRIKTVDTDGKTSGYAYGSFSVIDRPSIPIITNIENKCISTIEWSSSDQIAFEVEVYKGDTLEFSKKVSSSANNYKPNMFFSNTTYTIKLRVCNIYSLWSEWGAKIYTFNFTNPTKPQITITTNNTDILIKTNTVGSILYKSDNNINFKPIYKFDESKSYIDFNVASDKVYRYFIRNFETGYTDSDKGQAQVKINGFILQNEDGCVNALSSSEAFMPYNENLGIEKATNYYNGRTFGVSEYGEHQTRTITRDCNITAQQYDVLKDIYLSAKPIIYRDNRGNLFACDMDNIPIKNAVLNMKYSVSITVNQIDYREEINIYD